MEISFFLHASIKHQLLSTCLEPFLDDFDRFVLRLVCKELNKLLPRRNNSKELMEDFMKKKGYYYLYSIFFIPNDNGLCFIAFSTRDEIVQKEFILKDQMKENYMPCAVANENLELMKWLKGLGYILEEYIFDIAACIANLSCMKWLLENNCLWSKNTFSVAAYSGNLKNLKWLKENNCPYDKNECLEVSQNDIIKEWINKNL